jgi:hypothetical protein
MSVLPHARQMETLENLAANKTVAAPQDAEAQPKWRLVSRDGQTSSVSGLQPADETHVCADCLAGRCGQNPQGCKCSKPAGESTISLEYVTGTQLSNEAHDPAGEALAVNAAMPQAKPQLFEQATGQSSPANSLESIENEKTPFLDQGAGVPAHGPDRNSLSIEEPSVDSQVAVTPSSDDLIADLQLVIDRWPQLPCSTRQAILTLVGESSEADSA